MVGGRSLQGSLGVCVCVCKWKSQAKNQKKLSEREGLTLRGKALGD